MKTTWLKYIALSLFNILPLIVFSQPNPGGDPGGSGDPVGGGAPIGNGLLLLLALAGAYGLKKLTSKPDSD